jgi:hypothetical protein
LFNEIKPALIDENKPEVLNEFSRGSYYCFTNILKAGISQISFTELDLSNAK